MKDYPSKGLSSVPVSDQNEDDEFSATLVGASREEHTPPGILVLIWLEL